MGENNRFGFEWAKYDRIIPLYEAQFWAWVCPLGPEDFRGRRVLDAGCGSGRNSLWPVKAGASSVVAFDVDPRTTAVARRNLSDCAQVVVMDQSIYDIPFRNEFDIAMSIGVVHHLADPQRAVAQLVNATRPGGQILIWVYGKEGHTRLKNAVNAIRRVTCRLPLSLLDAIVRPFSLLWWTYMRLTSSQHPYMQLLQTAPYWQIHSILFDQLLPEIANYWTKEEALGLFAGLPVTKVVAHFCNEGSWTVIATKQD